jgi:hypothetical protein
LQVIFKITRIDEMPRDAYHVVWNVIINGRELTDHNGKARQPRPVDSTMYLTSYSNWE